MNSVMLPTSVHLFSDLNLTQVGWIAGLELLILAPWLFRYSRVIWLHFDQHFDSR